MKKFAIALAILALAVPAFASTSGVVINSVYGGGGSTTATATYNVDYVELYNSSAAAVNIGGWVIEYGSATGTWGSASTNYFAIPAGAMIEPCGYMLFQFGTPSSGGGPLPVAADYTNGYPNLSGTNGKVGLFTTLNSNVACNSEAAGTLVDKVAYGSSNCPEGAAVGVLSITTGAVRNVAGQDTDANSVDFSVVTGPVPHNKASSTGCPVATEPQSWGALKANYR